MEGLLISAPSTEDEAADVAPSSVKFKQGLQVISAKYYAGETILETARRGGLMINTNCVQGFCGSCQVSLLKGAVEMRKNKALTQKQLDNGAILACQSVPQTNDCLVEIDS